MGTLRFSDSESKVVNGESKSADESVFNIYRALDDLSCFVRKRELYKLSRNILS